MATVVGKRSRVVLAAVLVLVLVALVVARQLPHEHLGTIHGTIRSISAVDRVASLEFVHPKNGQHFELSGSVPTNCDIRINGRPADLSELHVGETVEVQGTIHRDNTLSANWVRVRRDEPSGTGRASTAPTRPAP